MKKYFSTAVAQDDNLVPGVRGGYCQGVNSPREHVNSPPGPANSPPGAAGGWLDGAYDSGGVWKGIGDGADGRGGREDTLRGARSGPG
eukprot:8078597-Pyramimonas_sp.AAC.1